MSLPSGWKLVKLADVAAKQPNALVDGPFGSNLKTTDYVNDGVPVLQGKNITGNKFQWFDVRFISEKKAHSLRRSLVKEGDILIVKIGSIGYSAQIDSLHGYPHAMIPANLCKLTPDLSVIDPTFLVYYLNSNKSVDYLRSNASATSQPALSLGKIKELPVPLPPLTEQKRIASLLARADRLRHLRRTAHELGESLLQSVFLEMFGDPVEDAHKWQVESLIDIINPERPITYGILMPGENLPDGVPYVRVVDNWDGRIDVPNVRRTSEEIDKQYKRSRLLPEDLLLTIRGQVGRLAIVPLELKGANITQDTARLDPIRSMCNVYYLFGCMQMPSFQHLMQTLTRGVAVTGINLGDVKELPIPLPPLNLQEEFAGVVARVESLRGRMSEGERQVEGLFESLLAESFGGAA